MADDPEPTSNLPVLVTPPAPASAPSVERARVPLQQLGDLPVEELEAIATEYGLDTRKYREKLQLVAAIHERRQLIATFDRAAMQDVLDWAGRSVPPGAALEQMAIEIAQVRAMRFNGLSERGLVVLCMLRGCDIEGSASRDDLVKALKKQEGFFTKMRRKTRGWLGKRVERMMGDEATDAPAPTGQPINKPTDPGPRTQALREEIEESGFFSGIANRVKKQADSYVNQKLDEIEARIDRKLDEIDRRLAEWRDKEIANRIRILKITLWASVVVAGVSLIYSFVQVEMKRWNQPTNPPPTNSTPSTTPTSLAAPSDFTALTARITETRMNRSSLN